MAPTRMMGRLFKIDRLSWKLGIGISSLVVAALAGGFLLVYQGFSDHLLTSARRNAAMETYLIRSALEYQMLEKDRTLIRQMVEGFADERSVKRVMVLDRTGIVRYSSDAAIDQHHFDEHSPTCQVCHQLSAPQRDRAAMLELSGGEVLRCVEPIPNREACHRCHDTDHRINGLIIVDVPISEMLGELQSSVMHLGLGTGALGLLLLLGIGLVFRRLVLRRLFRFAQAARDIGQGRLERRVPIEGNDALSSVEDEFNRMADSVSELLDQVRAQRASLEQVVNSVDDGMVVLDLDRKVVAANDAFLRRFSGSLQEILGQSCWDQASMKGLGCGCSDGRHGECPTMLCFSSGEVQTAIRTRVAADGTERQEEVRASPVVAGEGKITHVVEVWRDITDRRSAEARLADYQRMVSLGMLASGFSHEVNTPLGSIGTCLDGIKRLADETTPEARKEIAEYARIASTQVSRCGSITEQFLSLARGKSLSQEILDLHASANLIARLCEPTAREAGVKLRVFESDVPSVLANGSAVQQVLLNLVLNAIEASERGQSVTVRFAVEDAIEVVVEDDGRGIASEDIGRVFEPFYTRRPKGTGLGLFVSMNLARSWGGDIRVESTPGKGTRFSVQFRRDED